MFYKFSSINNRLTPSSQMAAYSPQGLTPYMGESAPITFSSKTVKVGTAADTVGQAVGRGMASSAAPGGPAVGLVPNNPGYQKIMELQKLFCKDDGKLVWMKRGARDMGAYYASMVLMAGGVGFAFYSIYQMSVKKN